MVLGFNKATVIVVTCPHRSIGNIAVCSLIVVVVVIVGAAGCRILLQRGGSVAGGSRPMEVNVHPPPISPVPNASLLRLQGANNTLPIG